MKVLNFLARLELVVLCILVAELFEKLHISFSVEVNTCFFSDN